MKNPLIQLLCEFNVVSFSSTNHPTCRQIPIGRFRGENSSAEYDHSLRFDALIAAKSAEKTAATVADIKL